MKLAEKPGLGLDLLYVGHDLFGRHHSSRMRVAKMNHGVLHAVFSPER